MSVANQPTNYNYLSPLGYKLVISRVPNVEFFVQRVSLPEISLPATATPTPFITINHPGDHLQFGQLTVTFRVNENLDNYLEIYNWMIALGAPERFSQYTLQNRPYKATGEQLDTTLSDISLVMLTSAMNGNVEFTMRDCFPTSLTNIDVDSTLTDVDYITATATFGIKDFTVARI
tara:strand:- start:762 stop:1289 length:528 start_codon:yes stop_codon:yes gene_type:complete